MPRSDQILTGWGRTTPSAAHVVPVDTEAALSAAFADVGPRGLLARGLGRSYGDAALNGGGDILDLTRLDRILEFDGATGEVIVEAGVSLDELMRRFVPRGWFVPVTPGTRAVTVGGAIAADIHGKNHHSAGSFGQHVRSIDLFAPGPAGDEVVLTLGPEDDRFWATVGGMGLTGVIMRATIALTAVSTSYLTVDTRRADDLDSLMSMQLENDAKYPYSVAWIDGTRKGERRGRGVISFGRFAEPGELAGSAVLNPLRFDPQPLATAPAYLPNQLLNRATISAFNELWFRKAPRQRDGEIQSIGQFFHPLDGVDRWNRLYGPAGFLQYQFVVPDHGAHVVRESLDQLAAIGAASFLAVLKRFGPASRGHLSFPDRGWTLALDLPATIPGLADVLDTLDERVVAAGGRIYLAKDSRMRPELLPAMYPRLEEWQAIRHGLDPNGVLTSDLARRLSL